MKELKLKYGCNPNQKQARIFTKDGELPIKILNGRAGYINLLDALNSWQLVKELKTATGLAAAASLFTREEKKEWLKNLKGVSLGSDAFFPFGDNIECAKKSGVSYIAQTGGSIRDDNVIETCDKYNMVMAFTEIRLFHN